MKKTFLAVAVASLLVPASPLPAADSPDLQMVTRIRQEGFRNSKVMDYAQGLTDMIGGRLTGSPNMRKANDWTRDELTKAGLANARLEDYKFGRGWSSDYTSVRMISPDAQQLYGLAMAWSPATNGALRGKVVKVKLESKEDLEKNKGTLAGAIVMPAEPKEMKPQDKAALERYTDEELLSLGNYEIPGGVDARAAEGRKRREFRKLFAQFAIDEKIAAIVMPANGEGGVFRVQSSGTHRDDEPGGVPTVGLAPEQYARIARMVDKKVDVELEIDLRVKFYDDPTAWNTVAEIPGTDKKGEVVMLGGHLDSWHTGTGATDNAAGVAAMMEAVRILKAIGVAPKRTIRIALWSGEEQGLLGSRAYVAEHVAKREEPKDPEQAKLPYSQRTEKTALTLQPEHGKISAYFNIDNGTGKLRGIYAQENAAVAPIFAQWLEPLKDLGATTVTMRNTGSTDHVPFDEVGVPAFQFIQDEVEYRSRTHHTNWDTYERLQRDDLMQAAVIAATFVWETANRAEMLPRKPLPK
ncbi:MAG TPA: M20/M25/M40 family metallo-hydrolase [Thermoanaerobaculia bacterium]|nr:M20/M25/M40 family metallo-hydrolase [Thermoanaerobaculia bacterium]